VAELFGIYRRLVGARIRSQLQYRLSFALNLFGMSVITFLDFAVILVLFEQIDALGEWSVAEVALLYAISAMSFALTDIAIGHLDLLPRMIREGDLDLVLVRPLGSLFQVIASDF
jgi:ABC-2 type transport system permease protein